jgi:hypothetical protein
MSFVLIPTFCHHPVLNLFIRTDLFARSALRASRQKRPQKSEISDGLGRRRWRLPNVDEKAAAGSRWSPALPPRSLRSRGVNRFARPRRARGRFHAEREQLG